MATTDDSSISQGQAAAGEVARFSIGRVLKRALGVFGRFPAAGLLALVNAIAAAKVVWAGPVHDGAYDDAKTGCAMLLASAAGIVTSVWAGRIIERFSIRRVAAVAVQCAVLLGSAALVWLFYGLIDQDECFGYPYALTLAAFASCAAFELGVGREDPADVVPMLAFSAIVGGIAAFTVAAGFSLVLLAVDTLFGAALGNRIYEWTWFASAVTVAPLFALAYGTRPERFEQPKVWRVLVGFVGFPLFTMLMAVMLAYAAKCAFSRSLPDGQVNWLAIMASSLWMLFHFFSAGQEGRFYRAFARLGGLAVLPLLVLQAAALWVRISDCGLTPARYLSCLFAVFAAVFAVGTLASRAFSRRAVFLVLAAFALFAAHSPWNAVDYSLDSQFARLESFRARHLAGEQFDEAARHDIMEVCEYTSRYEKGALRYRLNRTGSLNARAGLDEDSAAAFKNEWGFEYCPPYERRGGANRDKYLNYRRSNDPFSLAGYTEARTCDFTSDNGRLVIAGEPENDLLALALKELDGDTDGKDIRLDLGGGRVAIVMEIFISMRDNHLNYAYGHGLICR